jgi:SWI/SNF-related matrix-associated actin-dependent regulator 1 of chromatin subfamily A
LTRHAIGGAGGLSIEMSYGGRSRIRVSITATSATSLWHSSAKKNAFIKDAPSKPLIHRDNLPLFIKEALDKAKIGNDTNLWDLDSSDREPWPLYEEKPMEVNSKVGSISAHWIYPLRLLPNLEVLLKRAVEVEMQRQAPLRSSALNIRLVLLTEYAKRLILDCARIYREAKKAYATALEIPAEGRPISKMLPLELQGRELFRALKPYQLEGVEFALSRQGRLLLADAPGLGKTIQAIAIASCYEQDWPVLVICPSSLREMWANEFQRWCPGLSFNDISINFTIEKTNLTARVNIISYELLKLDKIMQKIPLGNASGGHNQKASPYSIPSSSPFGVVICDECHSLKTWNTARSKAIVPLVQGAKRAIMLSGTPATSRPSELHTQLSCILPRVFQFFPSFGERYCDPQPRFGGKGVDYSGASNLSELHLLLTESLMIRRRKAEVLGDMPAKRRHQLLLEIPKETRKTLIKMAQEMAKLREKFSGSGSKKAKASALSISGEDATSVMVRQKQIVLEMFQNAGRAKLPSAIAHLKQCISKDEDTKFLVFAHHIDILDGFSHALTEMNIEFVRIDGKTSSTSRQPLVDHFQTTPTCRVALLSILAAGVGITLTRASTVFFAELFWNPGSLLQAEDRAHRIGQDKEVDVYYMIAKGTYDEKLWDVVDSKLSVLSAVLDDQKTQFSLDSVSTRNNQTGPSAFGSSSRSSNGLDLNANLSDAMDDSFIQYLLQKIEGYEERSEEAKERTEVRRKARKGLNVLSDSEGDDDDELSDNQAASTVQKKRQRSASRASSSTRMDGASGRTAPAAPPISSTSEPKRSSYGEPFPEVLQVSDDDDERFDEILHEPTFKKICPLPTSSTFTGPPPNLESPTTAINFPTKEISHCTPVDLERKRSEKLAKFAAFTP